ncbi:MAG: glutathione S-transferase family protein [Deltaproteobacteria bacterium]|nr:glutathione S-transferase family protein [Deltaproteobacteria bacterium]
MIRLFEYPPSSNCQKVRLVLAEKNLPYESVLVNLRKNEQKRPEYLAINPYGLVPAMEDNGIVIYESTIINEYLEEAYPQVPLLPKEVGARCRVRLLEDFRDNHLYPAMKVISAATRGVKKEERDRAKIDAAFDSLQPMFQRLEDELAGKDYLVGSYSLADIAFTPNMARQIDLGVGLPARYPRIRAWVERVMNRRNYKTIAEFVSQH